MEARQGVTDAQIAYELRQGLPHLTDSVSLQDSRAGKLAEGTGTTEDGWQPVQKKRFLLRSFPFGVCPHLLRSRLLVFLGLSLSLNLFGSRHFFEAH